MLIRNSCPRCKGHLYIERDDYGHYKACMTCGYTCDLEYAASKQLSGTKHAPAGPRFQKYNEITPLTLK
jgi:DNA-directed RNA polymerase subunit M/transcription elongation factor TFIIS